MGRITRLGQNLNELGGLYLAGVDLDENKASVFLTRDKSLRDKLKKMIRVSEPGDLTSA